MCRPPDPGNEERSPGQGAALQSQSQCLVDTLEHGTYLAEFQFARWISRRFQIRPAVAAIVADHLRLRGAA